MGDDARFATGESTSARVIDLRSQYAAYKFSGGDGGGETPVLIPNTEVKPSRVDGTARETVWESRKLPGLNKKTLF